MKTRKMYMHTVRDRPATYHAGEQIALVSAGRYMRRGITLAASLKQIKQEQRASGEWRIAQGFDPHFAEYGYVLVTVPV